MRELPLGMAIIVAYAVHLPKPNHQALTFVSWPSLAERSSNSPSLSMILEESDLSSKSQTTDLLTFEKSILALIDHFWCYKPFPDSRADRLALPQIAQNLLTSS
jgi:hypothetical protein